MVTEADFRRAILPFTLGQEGGLSKDRLDPGNWTGGKVGSGLFKGTKYGIAASAHPTLDIASLTIEDASAIYWTDYVVQPGFDRLPLALLMAVFDGAVNCGPARAAAWLALAEHQIGVEAQIAAFSTSNLAFHRRLKSWSRYGKVWGRRIAACEKRALLLAAAAPVPVTAALLSRPAAAPVPKAATQPQAGWLRQLIRVLADALFQPQTQGAHP